MFTLLDLDDSKTLAIKVSDKLTHEDYEKHFIPMLEEHITKHGKVNIFIEAENFQGWEWEAAWDDFKTGIKHRNEFKKVAIVGDKAWEKWLSKTVGLFMDAEVKYFTHDQREEAVKWVKCCGHCKK
jgi:hypothetical protein